MLMWEIFSLGAVPYPEVSQIDMQFVSVSVVCALPGPPLYLVTGTEHRTAAAGRRAVPGGAAAGETRQHQAGRPQHQPH